MEVKSRDPPTGHDRTASDSTRVGRIIINLNFTDPFSCCCY